MEKKRLAKKKDYRLLCFFFYRASPHEKMHGLYKAGCKIAPNGTPCKRCVNCKYGKNVLNEIGKKIVEDLNAAMALVSETALKLGETLTRSFKELNYTLKESEVTDNDNI